MSDPHNPDKCPACGRAFESILDYPRVRVLAFERLPIPEAIDTFSAAAAEKSIARMRREPAGPASFREDGINMTPLIERACSELAVQSYLDRLAAMVGEEVDHKHLVPPIDPDRYFKRAHPVGNTGIHLSLADADSRDGDLRDAQVEVLSAGPNLGSAGGPTLQRLGAIASLRYIGLLVSQRSGASEEK